MNSRLKKTQPDSTSSGPAGFDWPIVDESIRQVFEQMLQDGSWGRYHGPHCDSLKAALAEFHQVEHVVLCSSGTSAVELALRGLQVAADDEVILCAYDYKANFANILSLGATPVLVDSLPGLPVMDVTQIELAVSEKTKAIICSHLHGCHASMDRIRLVADRHGIPIVEDACQSTGASIDGRKTGTFGDVGVLSFGGSKLLTAGRGGAVLTDDAGVAQRIRLYTQRGNDAYPLSEMQAAVLVPQLAQLPERNRRRLQSVQRILAQWPAERVLQPVCSVDPLAAQDHSPAFYKLGFCFGSMSDGSDRENVSAMMRTNGVPLDVGFPALHLIHSRKRFRTVGTLENAASLHETLMILHHPVLLQDDAGIDVLVHRLLESSR